jgi:methanogenic corrinoid protein MtbC1
LQLTEYTTPGAPAPPVSLVQGETIAELRAGWVSACLAYDEQRTEEMLALAFALYPVEAVCVELLQKGLAELGEGWYRGEVSVQQEHFASELAMRRLETLVAACPPPSRPERILVGCPPQEGHTFSALLLTLLLRRRGWGVSYLGANVPAARLEEAVAEIKPRLVILSAQQLHTAATTQVMGQLLERQGIPLSFGGRAFNLLPELRTRIPGHFLGEGLELAPQMAQQILSAPPPLPSMPDSSPAYRQALTHYRERQTQIKAQLWQQMRPDGVQPDHLDIANTHLELNILAALSLGDMHLLRTDIDWIAGLLSNRRLPGDLLPAYLRAYSQAAKAHLDERGAPLLTYLERLAAD